MFMVKIFCLRNTSSYIIMRATVSLEPTESGHRVVLGK